MQAVAASLYHTKTQGFAPLLHVDKITNHFPTSCRRICCNLGGVPSNYKSLKSHGFRSKQPFDHGLAVGCVALDSGARELEAEIKTEEEEEEWMIMGRLRENCEESGGVVELLECLEREAIMGEDEGKEPTDYNRRAQIFDKSARVFQALKERTTPSHQP